VAEAALRAAVAHGEELAAEVYVLAQKFLDGVYPLAGAGLVAVLWLHVLAAARH
jgi:hypothetical protein